MLLTIKMIIEQKLLDEYCPDRKSFKTKQSWILDRIRSGEILVAKGAFKKKKLVPSESLELFRKQFIIK